MRRGSSNQSHRTLVLIERKHLTFTLEHTHEETIPKLSSELAFYTRLIVHLKPLTLFSSIAYPPTFLFKINPFPMPIGISLQHLLIALYKPTMLDLD
jgi:hypothetical protein